MTARPTPPAPAGVPLTARAQGIMQGFPPPPDKRPSLLNWDLPPYNRWSFLNMHRLFPTADVFRGTGPESDLRDDPADLDNTPVTVESGDTLDLSHFLQTAYADGILVMHRGRAVYERYFNDMAPHSLHLSQSVAKSVTALVTGAMWADGLLDLDAPLADIIPELSHSGYADATLDQVLDMRSGVRFTEDYNTPGSDMTRIDIASGWRPADPHHGRPTIRDVILSLPKIQPHGGAFNYRSIETDMVAWVMERVAGTDLATLLGTRIWQHIGATRDANFTVDAEATALADGGFNATLRDYARLGQLILDGGRAGDRQIVPQAWIDQMRSGDPSLFGAPWSENFPNGAYRRFWWIRDADRGDICARGVFGQFIYVDPESDLVIALVSSWPDYLIGAYTRNTMRAFDAIRDALGA
ncbi:serine hydrolase domain-containing protein [Roseovarius indicus]|uniref:serine hydrolase domain-containing protein n=1 Tax=Roseovarius indicus TaxID=540747 RepID=UPI0032ED11E7